MLRFAILELLSVKPLSGYELKKRFGGSIVFFWRAAHSQIYPELKSMESDGLVAATEVAHPWRPTKKVYSITDAGRDELVAWLRDKAKIQVVKDEMMLRCFAFHLVSPDEAAAQIEHHRALHVECLERYREIEREIARKNGDPRRTIDAILFWNHLTLERAVAFERMYVDWCDSALRQQAAFRERVAANRARIGPSFAEAAASESAGGLAR